MKIRNVRCAHGMGLILAAGVGGSLGTGVQPSPQPPSLPTSITLTGIVRDFRGRDENNGHVDFEWEPGDGFGHYIDQVQDTLGPDGLPRFNSVGRRVLTQWTDASGRNIIRPRPYIETRPGDRAGSASSSSGDSIHSDVDFRKWYRPVPGVNMAETVSLTLTRNVLSGQYVFDDTRDAVYGVLGGFFPINGRLFGNYGSTGKNYHFTYMLDTTFQFRRGAGQVFTFTGDDDVWVFVDGKLVIDLGGVHIAVSQTIELDRLGWLVDGQTYSLKFFFAERHTTKSNFRIETNLPLAVSNSGLGRPEIKGWQERDPVSAAPPSEQAP